MYVLPPLTMQLLDILVKNCGFPMHLQIATKEFLNELVRRFPERPPMHPGPVMTRILEMIHEWRQTICVTSKYKEDLVHIRDMHRLLMYKGYRFPKVDARSAAVLSTSERLQSPEELEEETRAAQSAKLQELIRRGTPRDLQQAQELMKILSGAEPEKNNVHAKQISRDMDKIESRIKLLNDMLDQAKETDKFVAGDAYDQVASNLRGVQPRLQKWIEQAEEDESEYLQRFLEVNDKILQALDRYDVMATGTSRPRARGTELISFDEAEEAPTPNPPSSAPGKSKAPSSFLDDLESLSLHDTTSARPSAPSSASSQAKPKAAQSSNVFDLLGDMDEPLASPNTPAAAPSRPLTSLTTSSSSTAAPPAAHDPFAGLDFLK